MLGNILPYDVTCSKRFMGQALMCFEYADFLWRFELESHAINWEENTVRFQHLLETFRFLDNPYAR